jgi:hypothetical protein
MTYAVDVTVSTHDALREGTVELSRCPGARSWHRILIAASEVGSDQEAVLLAAQMATHSGTCTSARLVSWPEEDS